MVDKTLSFLKEELNTFVSNKDFRYRDKTVVLISDLTDHKGEPTYLKQLNVTSGDFLLLTLINVEEETIGKSQSAVYKKPDESLEVLNPELKLNIYVLISAVSNMDESQRYTNCLRLLSYCVGCFQYRKYFNRVNAPALPPEIGQLVAELVSPTFEQQNHIWGGLGTKYQPSVLYKIKMLVYQEILDRDGDLRVRRVNSKMGAA